MNQQILLPFGNPPPIYLFIYPLPMTVSGIKSWEENRTHFWSLDENGRSEMTEEECRRWGVPELDANGWYYDRDMYTWPSHVYPAIRNWQVARGFDPTTADFARSLGLPEWEILIDNEAARSRFEEVDGESSDLAVICTLLIYNSQKTHLLVHLLPKHGAAKAHWSNLIHLCRLKVSTRSLCSVSTTISLESNSRNTSAFTNHCAAKAFEGQSATEA
jgi:hypothetical protein